jgi:hypothetical protein
VGLISLRAYWILVVTSLIVFICGVWFVLVPFHIIDGNLGTDLIIQAGGTLFTIVFLTTLVAWAENSHWKSIKDRVISRLKWQLYIMSYDIMGFFEGLTPYLGTLVIPEYFVPALKKGGEEAIPLDEKYYEAAFSNRRAAFVEWSNYLDSLETKYSRFLGFQILYSVMKIQDDISRIIYILERWGSDSELLNRDDTKKDVALIFRRILRETYNIYREIETGPKIYQWWVRAEAES